MHKYKPRSPLCKSALCTKNSAAPSLPPFLFFFTLHCSPLYSTVLHQLPNILLSPHYTASTHRAQLLTFLPLSLFRRILVSSRCSCGGEEKTLRFERTLAIEIAHAWGLLVATIYIRATSDRDLGLLVEEEGQKKYISKIHVCAVVMK